MQLNQFNIFKLTRRNITIWYLLTIPLFAILYYFISDDFYHSTVKYESYTKEELKVVKDALSHSIKKNFLELHGKAVLENEYQSVDINELVISRIDVQNEDIIGTILLLTPHKKRGLDFDRALFINFKIPKGSLYHSGYVAKRIEVNENLFPPILKEYPLFRKESVKRDKKGDRLKQFKTIRINHTVNEQIDNLTTAYNGFPSKIRGNYIRMLYLSATTITTLGLGDILPISNRARLLITIETVLGMILVGLFINTVVVDVKGKNQPQTP